MAGGGGTVGLHRDGGVIDAVLAAGTGLFHHHKAGGGRCWHAQPDRHVQPLGQKAADGFFDHFFLYSCSGDGTAVFQWRLCEMHALNAVLAVEVALSRVLLAELSSTACRVAVSTTATARVGGHIGLVPVATAAFHGVGPRFQHGLHLRGSA